MSACRGRRVRDDRGSFTLELTVLFPIVLLLIFTVVQGAMYFHARNVALAAAQEGVRAARAEDGTAAAGSSSARSFVEQAGGADIITGLRVAPRRSVTEAQVTVSGQALSVLPGLPGLTISQTAAGPVERFTDSGGP